MKTAKAIVYLRLDIDSDCGYRHVLVDPENRYWVNDEDIKLEQVEVSYALVKEYSQDELRLKAIATLRDKQQVERARSVKACVLLQDKINSLLRLEHLVDSQ